MFRKKSKLQKARRRLKKRRWLFDRRSLPERIADALAEALDPRR